MTPVGPDGAAEVVGVPPELVEHFSKRRAQVEARAATMIAEREASLGRSLSASERAGTFQLAAYKSRSAKPEGGERTEQLRQRWRYEATEAGYPPEAWLAHAPGPHDSTVAASSAPRARPGAGSERTMTEVLGAIEEASSTWGRADVVEAVAARAAPTASSSAAAVREMVEAVADELLARPEVISLGPSALITERVPEALRRADGMEPTLRHGAARYSTWRTLEAEQAVLEAAEAGRDASAAIAAEEAVETAVEGGGLGADQAEAVRRLCLGGERISVLVGPAGAGKSRGLSAARAAWEASGATVRGVAPSAVAAGVLTEQAGIPSETLAKFLLDAGRGQATLRPGEVIVCDEASMVTTHDLAALVGLVERAGGKLVLLGDPHQLGPVGAGGLFRLLANDAKTAELTSIWRFDDPWEAGATTRLRQGDATVFAEYEGHGRVLAGTGDEVLDAAHRAWTEARARGHSVVVMAADHATVDRLALRARAARVAAGEVEEDGLVVGNQVVGVGDEVVTTRNSRRLVTNAGAWVRNGDRWQVLARRPDGSLLVSSLEDRGKVVLPAAYSKDEVALAYSVTVHKSQGLTTDEAVLVVGGATTAEHLYVGLTRGRQLNVACVVCEPADDGHGFLPAPSARDVLDAALRRSDVELAATEAFLVSLEQTDDLLDQQPSLRWSALYSHSCEYKITTVLLARLRVWGLSDLGARGGPVLGRVDRDARHLELVGVHTGHLAEARDLAPDRGGVHAEARQTLEAPVEVPHDPEPHHVLHHLTGDGGHRRLHERRDGGRDVLVHEGCVLLPGTPCDPLALGALHRVRAEVG